jgi:Uncharacterized protein conserved in bacteria
MLLWAIQYRSAEVADKRDPAHGPASSEPRAGDIDLAKPRHEALPPAEPPKPAESAAPATDATRSLESRSEREGETALEPDTPPPPPPLAPERSAAEPPQRPFSVVPVFFGTDRARLEGAKRLDYGAERGRRLELGRALVSVPTSHEVPDIERPWALRIPYFDVKIYEQAEDPAKHFTVREIRTVTREEMLRLVSERLAMSASYKDHALVFVHGFNTSFDNAVYRTAQIAHDIKFDGAPFLYSWPSGGAVASYTYDLGSSVQSQPFMREFIEMVARDTNAKAVSVIAHSMGNQPVLQVLKDIRSAAPDVVIHQVILAAPDVDRDNFENIAREIKGFAKGITLYAAANDRALGVSRRFHGGVPRAGDVPPSGPIVTEGVDTIDVTAISTESLALNHSSYAESNVLLEDIRLILQTGVRPPEKRVPKLARVPTAKGDYWRYAD